MSPRRGFLRVIAACLPLVAAAPATAAPLAFDRPETQVRSPSDAPPLAVGSPAFRAGGPIPQTYAASGKNISPAITWSGAPAATRAFVLIAQDADVLAPDATPPSALVHWLAYDIPGAVTALARGVRNTAEPTSPLGMLQGWNYHGSVGYSGPRPPPGDPPHHYHFQVFALDRKLRVKPGAQPAQVLRAMAGHVLARGDLVGLYAEPTPKAAAPASP